MSKKENSLRELLSNVFFVLGFLFKTNKKMFFARAFLSAVQIFAGFIPIIFLRLILNALTDTENIKGVVLYILVMTSGTLVTDALGSVLSYFDNIL